MPLINVIMVLVNVGVLLYVVETLLPIDATIKTYHSYHCHLCGLHMVAAGIQNHWTLGISSLQIVGARRIHHGHTHLDPRRTAEHAHPAGAWLCRYGGSGAVF